MSQSKFAYILEAAKTEYAKNPNWIDFKNMFFSQDSQYMPKNEKERLEYLKSEEYQEVRKLSEQLEEQQPGVDRPTYNGKILVRVGSTLHRSLIEEAEKEGMTLNQLIIAKLAPPLYDRVRGPER